MDIKNILRTYQGIAVSIAVLVFCGIALFSGVIPSIQKVKEMFVAVSSLKEDNAKLIGKAEILESYDEQDLKQKLSLVLSAVPGNKGLPGLFSTVEKVAKTAGVTLLNMSVTGGTIASISAQKQSAA